MTTTPLLVTLAAVVVGGVAARRALRGRSDLLAAHARNMVRHALALILMLGTLAGTVFTFSAGALTLHGAWERIVSVGGVAAALEAGVIYTGWYIGQLDLRIQTARRPEDRAALVALQSGLYKWFYAVISLSAVANFAFRLGQLHNVFYAALVSGAPIVLVILFTIKLRPLPEDYEEMARQASARALVLSVRVASDAMLKGLTRMGRGETLSESEWRQMGLATGLIGMYAPTHQRNTLDYIITTQRQLPAGDGAFVVEGTAVEYLTTADIMREWGVSRRTAQHWATNCPGKRTGADNHTWEAPRSAIVSAHGAPSIRLIEAAGPESMRTRKRNAAQNDASDPRTVAGQAPAPASDPQPAAAGAYRASVREGVRLAEPLR